MKDLYETDFYRWCITQADSLRMAQPEWLDWANVAKEIESLGRFDRRAMQTQLTAILEHLLALFATGERDQHWHKAISRTRDDLAELLEESPSLRGQLATALPRAYEHACYGAGIQLGLDKDARLNRFPAQCPWVIEAILDHDFFP